MSGNMSPSRKAEATLPTGHDHGRQARKPMGRAASGVEHSGKPRTFAKSSRRRTGPSVDYTPDIFGNWLTPEFIAEVEAQYDRLTYRRDPRKIVREIAKRTGATEEAIAHILLIGKLRQYRAESREFRRRISEAVARADEAGAAAWRKTA